MQDDRTATATNGKRPVPALEGPRLRSLDLEVPADTAYLQGLRLLIGAWLQRTELSDGQQRDLVLAVDEALANAMLHAYPKTRFCAGKVLLTARTARAGGVVVRVRDYGRWSARESSDGRGINIMRALVPAVRIARTNGTQVQLEMRPEVQNAKDD